RVTSLKITFFKQKQIQEASSYCIPEDSDDEEELEAYGRGRALAQLKEAHGSKWIKGARPKDERVLIFSAAVVVRGLMQAVCASRAAARLHDYKWLRGYTVDLDLG
ncbi:MAG: hypothetical protein SGPRY_004405, partial [Prymnesium sp.]